MSSISQPAASLDTGSKSQASASYSSRLINEDIAPARDAQKTWGVVNFFALWVGMAVCIPTYMIAASLIQGGMSWWQAMLTVMLGNVIVLIPMILSGHAGAKHGVPFPVFARASFGIFGANIPALLRAIVACGWFGIQSWIGGSALYTIVLIMFPGVAEAPTLMPDWIGVSLVQFVCFMAFWAINIYLIWRGVESIKHLETAAAPFLILCGLGLLAWAWTAADGFGPMLDTPSSFASSGEFWQFFFPSLTAMVGYWATLSLNISDFTRYARSQRSQMVGQALGLPTTMTLFAFIGVAVTSATVVIYGEAIWDPVVLVRRFDSPVVVSFAMLAVVIATLSTNVAANVVGPANDFSSLWPSKIDFKRGGYITGVIGIVMMPWKLLADPSGYIFTWLIGYSALLGPIVAILLTDYFVLRRCHLETPALYQAEGQYRYQRGFNARALAAFVLGVLPNLPGFLVQLGVLSANDWPLMANLYSYAWFIGFAIAALSYWILMQLGGVSASNPAAVQQGGTV